MDAATARLALEENHNPFDVPGSLISSLRGNHISLTWSDEHTACLGLQAMVGGQAWHFEISAAVLHELAALTQHPQFAACLAAVEAAGEPPALAVEDVS